MDYDNAGVASRLVKPHVVTTDMGKHALVSVAWEKPQNLHGGVCEPMKISST